MMNESMNKFIKDILNGFTVNGVSIPCKFLYYHGNNEPYITWLQEYSDSALRGDDDLLGYVDYYDFDVYAKGDYTQIIEQLKQVLESNGFIWQPLRSSSDMYETDTGYYHKTLSFAIYREREEN